MKVQFFLISFKQFKVNPVEPKFSPFLPFLPFFPIAQQVDKGRVQPIGSPSSALCRLQHAVHRAVARGKWRRCIRPPNQRERQIKYKDLAALEGA